LEYRKFLRQFKAKVVANTDSDDEKMNYLEQFTYGEANKVVSGFSHLKGEQAFAAAIKQLEERYGDKEVIATSFIKKALDWPVIRAGDSKALDEFSLFLVECDNAAESIRAGRILEYTENIRRLMSKLPFHLHDRWRNIVFRTKEGHKAVKFADFVHFVKAEAKKANDPTYGNIAVSGVPGNNFKIQNPKRVPSSGKNSSTNNITCEVTKTKVVPEPKCSYCDGSSHALDSCKSILSVSMQDRYTYLRSKALCFGCLKKEHVSQKCRNRATCLVCKRRHPTILHNESKASANETGR